MDARTDIKKRLPSRHVTEGPERAPNRSDLYAMGLASAQACPSAGVCGAQFTDLATVSESIGLAPPYSAGAAASGGSTNAALHLPAVAHECDIKFDLFDVAEIFKKTPYVADLKPGGRYVAKDMFEAGGIPLLMKILLDHGYLHGDCLTVTGQTIAENLKNVKWNPHQDVVRSADKPITVTGEVVGPKGNLAPDGAIVKVAGMSNLKFTGPARCFDREEDAIALLCDGDLIEIDAEIGALNVKLSDAERAERKTKWRPRATNHRSGALWKYASQVGPAIDGAVTHPGRAHEKQCYADI
jgi:dihydroxyacid dehydratase/phosphogluconate dehydratase